LNVAFYCFHSKRGVYENARGILETFTCAIYISDQTDTYVHASKLMVLQCSLLWLQHLSNQHWFCMHEWNIKTSWTIWSFVLAQKNKFCV